MKVGSLQIHSDKSLSILGKNSEIPNCYWKEHVEKSFCDIFANAAVKIDLIQYISNENRLQLV